MTGSIALDATYSVGKHLTGVGVYGREIISALAAQQPSQKFLAAFRSQRLLGSLRTPLPPAFTRTLLWDSGILGRPILFHGLNQRMPFFRIARSCCTFHDLFVMSAEYSTPEFRARFTAQARHAATTSDLVICVSSFTASQVETLLEIPRARIRVIHHGVQTPPPAPAQPREPLVLHVGSLQRRKNLVRLVGAFETSLPAPWQLVLAGSKQGFGAHEILDRVAASPARARIQLTGYLTDSAIEALYARASIFAFPSLDEGFGMPVLDAMARGVPVIASNRSALPEVCSDAALLIDPLDQDELAHALAQLARDAALHSVLTARGYRQAAAFTWSEAARKTWDVYRELLL